MKWGFVGLRAWKIFCLGCVFFHEVSRSMLGKAATERKAACATRRLNARDLDALKSSGIVPCYTSKAKHSQV